MTKRITARYIRRRTPQEITTLAREAVTRQKLVTADPEALQCAFMIVKMLDITPAAAKRCGALIGDYARIVPGRGLNGWPIFTTVDFLHRDDLPAYNAELHRMRHALGYAD